MNGPSFLQSPAWQKIQERMSRPTLRIESVLVIRHELPFGLHYFYAPHPTSTPPAFFAAASRVGRDSGALFLKVDPLIPLPPLRRLQPAASLQPRLTLLIDCRQKDDSLLAAMHPKTRYNVRLAERRGVSVRIAEYPVSAADFGVFWELLAASARRDGFSPHSREHYRILLEVRSPDFVSELFIAELGGMPIAAAIINFYAPSGTATYLHGGSSRPHRAAMAPHLLHWRAVQEVRSRGLARYDLGGVDDARWPGLTRFKRGFGGAPHAHSPSADYVFRLALYRLYRSGRALRRFLL